MRRNKLYTVNRWNKPLFVFDEDLNSHYDIGGFLQGLGSKTETLGSVMGGSKIAGSPMGGIVSGLGSAVGKIGGDLISGGLSSGAGSAVSNIGGTVGGLVGNVNPVLGAAISAASGIVGGGINALFGESVNEEALKEANEGTAQLNNTRFTASSTDDLAAQLAAQTSVANVADDIYEGGLFNDVSDKNEELKRQRAEAKMFAGRSLTNAANNIFSNQLNDALANYASYGGLMDFGGGALGLMQQNRYLDTIDKRSDALANKNTGIATAFTGGARTYADGGLEATLLDSFGTDPIGAAVRYNQGLEQLAAQREAEEAQAAREAEYADMQKRLANLETQNQGLQALMAAQHTQLPVIPEIEEAPVSSSPSPAIRSTRGQDATWDYVEDQLRKSGKFNDIQIEGIKYNLQRESALNPDIVGDGGAAFGLAQWHGIRQPKDKSLEGQTRHLIETLSNFDGGVHWIGKNNYYGFMNARTPEEAHYWIAKGYERPRADIIAKVKRDSDMSLKRLQAFGGELGTNGTDFTNGLLYIDEGGSHEENPFEGVPMGVDAEGIPNLVEEGETVYNDYVFSDRMKVPDFMYKELGLGGVIKKKGKEMSFADASKKLAQESEQRPNDPISQAGLNAALSKLAEVQETERMKKNAEEYIGLEGYACGGKMKKSCGGKIGKKYATGTSNFNYGKNKNLADSIAFTPLTDKELQDIEETQFGKPITGLTDEQRQDIAMDGYTSEIRPDDAKMVGLTTNYITGNTQEGYNPYPTWMRYAPTVGAGVMSLTDMLGLTNKPDYTMAGKLEAAAERAGYAPDVKYDPIGDYMRFVPLDRMFKQNSLDATARAAERTILNSSMPASTKYALLLANNYNNQIASGNLFRQEQEYNDENRRYAKDFNRKTNMFNSQMGLEAAMANARYRQQAQSFGLNGLAQAAALRDSIDQRVGAARSANLTNFLTSLGNIGRENFALNQINSDRSRQYGVYRNGTSEHKRSSKGKKGSRWT